MIKREILPAVINFAGKLAKGINEMKSTGLSLRLNCQDELLEKINSTGIGPAGYGGKTTALTLNIETLPTHIAGMPVAVSICCHVARHKEAIL